VFEISCDNGLINIYALCKTRGEGGKPDPKLKALLADRAQRLKEKQEMAKLVSRGVNSYARSLAVLRSAQQQNRLSGTPVPPMSRVG